MRYRGRYSYIEVFFIVWLWLEWFFIRHFISVSIHPHPLSLVIGNMLYNNNNNNKKTTFINSIYLQNNDTWVYRVQTIKNRINIRSVTWMSMLFEGGNPSLIPKYCQSWNRYVLYFGFCIVLFYIIVLLLLLLYIQTFFTVYSHN